MLEMTTDAKAAFDGYFADKTKETIRIYVAGGCSGPQLALALDAKKDEDEVLDVNGYEFVVEKALYEEAKPITIDANPMGFAITSAMKFPEGQGGGSCGSCCGGCG